MNTETMSHWLQDAIKIGLSRDCLDFYNDTLTLLEIARKNIPFEVK